MTQPSLDSAKGSESKAQASASTRRQPSNIPKIFASGDPAAIQREIRSVYGCAVTERFAIDLLAFVEKAVKGDYVQ